MRGRTGNLIGKKLTADDLYRGMWEMKEQINEKRINNWIDAGRLLILKKTYTGSTTTATFDFNTVFGGGNVSFTGHATFNNSTGWGPQYLFDNTRTASDWCNLSGTSPLFGQWVFPVEVVMKKIFIIPRGANDNFPTSVTLKVDTATVGTYNTSTLAADSGQQISYTGTGYNITLDQKGTTWRLEFPAGNAYIGEIEFWGYV